MSDPLRVGGLYSGIYGIELGLERAGMQVEWVVEIDDFCNRVLAKNRPHVTRYRDVRDVGCANAVPVDVLCGGFPCQPHSVAGQRRGSADERDLWPEFRRLIREFRPRWVVAENVSGLLSTSGGRFFGGVLRDLADSGYDAEWRVLRASDFGAPHERERVIIVAYPCGQGLSRPVLGRESLREPTDTAPTQFGDSVVSCGFWHKEHAGDLYVGDGVPRRLARRIVKACGNAVVPQMAEYVGRCIVAADAALRDQQGRGVREA